MAGIDMKHLIQSAKVSSEICRASDIPGFQSVEDFLLTCLLLHDSIKAAFTLQEMLCSAYLLRWALLRLDTRRDIAEMPVHTALCHVLMCTFEPKGEEGKGACMSGYQLMRRVFRDADARCFITPQSVWKKDETFYACERYVRNYVKEYIEVENR